jgi:hypothetical protein
MMCDEGFEPATFGFEVLFGGNLTTREKAGFTGLEADFSLITIKPD